MSQQKVLDLETLNEIFLFALMSLRERQTEQHEFHVDPNPRFLLLVLVLVN